MALFSSLSERLNHIFSKLTKRGKLTELEIKTAMREVRVALMLGVVLGLVNFARIYFLEGYSLNVALVVSLAMFLTIIIAKSIGCTLPLLAKAVHLDPAMMASPIITTLVDAASLTILFTIATRVLNVSA